MQIPGEDRRVVYGTGSIGSVPDLIRESGCSKPLLVTALRFAKSETWVRLKESLETDFAEFKEITTGPPLPEIEHLAEAYRNKGCDSIISVGDRSVVFAARLLKYYYAYDSYHIAVPVVPSVSPFSNWASYWLGDEAKYVTDSLMPTDSVILDPCPLKEDLLSAWNVAGLSVVQYALTRLRADPIVDKTQDLLLSAIENLIVNLPGTNAEARLQCLLAPWYAKDENYSVRNDHTMIWRNCLVAELGVSGEAASAIILPEAAYSCGKEHPERMAKLAKRLGFKGQDIFELSDRMCDLVSGLIRKLDATSELIQYGVDQKVLENTLESLKFSSEAKEAVLESFF